MTERRIRITEMAPRDGLQNERELVPLDAKVAFIDRLSDAGVSEIEVTSFVSPTWVPQLADASEVLARIKRRPDTVYSALVPNMKGFERALAAGVGKIAVFAAASESFSRANINATIAESIERFRPVVAAAHHAGLPVRGYVSCAVACPFEGPIAPDRVASVSRMLLDLGVDEIDLGDTIGVAVPGDIDRLLAAHDGIVPLDRTILHLHDTRGTALACAWRGAQLGVDRFDACCGGLGGCPYAPGASGNLATEEIVYAFEGSGLRTGVDVATLLDAGRIVASALGRTLSSRLLKAGLPVPRGSVSDDAAFGAKT